MDIPIIVRLTNCFDGEKDDAMLGPEKALLVVIALGVFPAVAGPAHRDRSLASVANFAVVVNGRCELRFDKKPVDCDDGLIIIGYKIGRSEYTINTKTVGAVSFSGGKDSQPSVGHYELNVDRVKLEDGATVRSSGICAVDLNADGSRFYKVLCHVIGNNNWSFDLDYTPTDQPPVSLID